MVILMRDVAAMEEVFKRESEAYFANKKRLETIEDEKLRQYVRHLMNAQWNRIEIMGLRLQQCQANLAAVFLLHSVQLCRRLNGEGFTLKKLIEEAGEILRTGEPDESTDVSRSLY